MLLTVFCLRRDRSELTFSLQVDADFELQNFRALCALESGVPASESQIIFAEQPLTDNHRSLASYGLKDGDVVILQQVENGQAQSTGPFPGMPRIDFSSIAVPGTSTQFSQALQPPPPAPAPPPPSQAPAPPASPDPPSIPQGLDNPALLRAMLLANPHELSLLKERNPPLAEALLSGDLEKFTQVLVEQQQDRARREQERIRLFSADPFDLEAQAKIEEDIRQQNIEENMTIAMEESPESFGQVVMLYINCKVNGHPVKAFVDSGGTVSPPFPLPFLPPGCGWPTISAGGVCLGEAGGGTTPGGEDGRAEISFGEKSPLVWDLSNAAWPLGRCPDDHHEPGVRRAVQHHAIGGRLGDAAGVGTQRIIGRVHLGRCLGRSRQQCPPAMGAGFWAGGMPTCLVFCRSPGADRRGFPPVLLLHPGGAAHGHAAGPGHAEEAPGKRWAPDAGRRGSSLAGRSVVVCRQPGQTAAESDSGEERGPVRESGEDSDEDPASDAEMGPGPSGSGMLPPESGSSEAEEQGESVPSVHVRRAARRQEQLRQKRRLRSKAWR
uniref:Ubiquitin-like domain-containing protein n=1 Tax=Naja naja TaxID=35670 RepID=A0A8C6YJ83_NAJNA